MKNKNIEAVYFLRTFAMLSVVLIHTIGAYYTSFEMDSGAFQKYHYLSRTLRVEKGIFIMLTGLVFFYSHAQKRWTKDNLLDYYKKRFKFIIVPYLIWASVYEFYAYSRLGREFVIGDVISRIVQGESHYQLYFIFIIVQIYMILPAVIWISQRFSIIKKYLWLCGILIQFTYFVIQSTFDLTSSHIFLSNMSYLLLGGWIGLHYETEKAKGKNNIPIIIFGVMTLITGSSLFYLHYYGYTLQEITVTGTVYTLTEITYLVIGSYFFYKLAEKFAAMGSTKMIGRVKHFAVYSFAFYLIHPLILREVAVYTPTRPNYWFHFDITIRYMVTVIFCYLVIRTIHLYIPLAHLIFGKLPATQQDVNRRKFRRIMLKPFELIKRSYQSKNEIKKDM
ncbi:MULTISPECIES: acyltransferase [Paraliobacillus]|uniref:acyltransferase n=1 Tax=Paraliobacillus TaxID=200903 RepID=UPI000E3D654E|nr:MULTISPECIES: acyltransferase [Paraliobacillus]